MPKRISKRKRPSDVNQWAHALGNESTQPKEEETLPTPTKEQISQLMAAIGRKGGKVGGKRRLQTMTPEQRSQSAFRAAQARWKKKT
jgi:hypothetical protein